MKIDINYLREIDSPPTKTQMDYAEKILSEFEDNVEACEFLGNLAIVIYLENVDVWIWKTKISIGFNKDGKDIHNNFDSINSAIINLKEIINVI